MNELIIYLDNCCYNRPYDDFSNLTVYLEAESKLYIQDLIKKDRIKLIWSYILEYENSANPNEEVKNSILVWKKFAINHIFENDIILKNANHFYSLGFGSKDSIHIACAIESKSDFFITTDKGILKKSKLVNQIKIINPINFVQFLEENYENR